jgi:hypothetical protein
MNKKQEGTPVAREGVNVLSNKSSLLLLKGPGPCWRMDREAEGV